MTFSPSIRKLSNLADKFELKMFKYAQNAGEADSTQVTLAVRPTVNNTLTNMKFNNVLQTALQNASDAAFKAGKEISGGLSISQFVTNGMLTGGKWTVNPATSGLRVSGSLLQSLAGTTIKSVIAKANAAIIINLNKELNRVSSNLNGTSITNNETDINEISLNV